MNGDGYDDIIIGAPHGDAGGFYAGLARLYFGRPGAAFGHSEVGNTYWYIEAVPELLQLATERLAMRRSGGNR